MAAYIIVIRETPVVNGDAMAAYSQKNRANAAAFKADFGIEPLAAYGGLMALEGDAPDGVVMLKFPSMEQAQRWYNSDAYQDALPHRLDAASWRVFITDGLLF